MLKFENLQIRIEGDELFRLNELELKPGIVALVGRNGSGKSTFIRTILGEHNDYSGRIEVNGHGLHTYKRSDLSKQISVVYSRPQIFGNHTVKDLMLLGRIPYQGVFGGATDSDMTILQHISAVLRIDHLLDQEVQFLSDGERQLAMIGRALVQDTAVLLMDEPSAFLDIVNRYQLMEVMQTIVNESNKLILFSTHHLDILSSCDHVLLIDEGQMKVLHEINSFERRIKESFGLEIG